MRSQHRMVVHLLGVPDLPWTPSQLDAARARAHRILLAFGVVNFLLAFGTAAAFGFGVMMWAVVLAVGLLGSFVLLGFWLLRLGVCLRTAELTLRREHPASRNGHRSQLDL